MSIQNENIILSQVFKHGSRHAVFIERSVLKLEHIWIQPSQKTAHSQIGIKTFNLILRLRLKDSLDESIYRGVTEWTSSSTERMKCQTLHALEANITW